MSYEVLVTGGAGYIGSHTVIELINAGFKPIIVDDLSNARIEVLARIEQITGTYPVFYQTNIRDKDKLTQIFKQHNISAVIHFAAFKAVGESVMNPLKYYQNNVAGSLDLVEIMFANNVKTLVFSSSATVYGEPDIVPITEDFPFRPASPYGRSKCIVEDFLADFSNANPDFQIARLRYFNPVGAHQSGLIGEDPNGIPNNLMPYITQVAVGKREFLNIFGNDYPTKDGTGVRDYIHVVDLARGHLLALKYFMQENITDLQNLLTVNLGTGIGYSVLDVVKAFETASNKNIKYNFVARRDGDVPCYYADPSLAEKILNFKTHYTLDDMCRDSWNWQYHNPNGYLK